MWKLDCLWKEGIKWKTSALPLSETFLVGQHFRKLNNFICSVSQNLWLSVLELLPFPPPIKWWKFGVLSCKTRLGLQPEPCHDHAAMRKGWGPSKTSRSPFFLFFSSCLFSCHCQNHSWFHTQPQPCVSRVWFHSPALTSAVKPQPAGLSCSCSKAISSQSPQKSETATHPQPPPNAAAHSPDHCLSQQNEDFWWQKTSKHHLNFVILQKQNWKYFLS